MGGRALYAPLGGFLAFTKKYFKQPIPETSWIFQTFGYGYPYDFFIQNLHPLIALWDTQYKND